MIKRLHIEELEAANAVWAIQIPSYEVEARLIDFYEIPPLRETVEELRQCGELFYGLWIQDELAGAISYKRVRTTLDIHRMMVHPNHFRKGVAKKLLAYVEKREAGIKEILVSTGARNLPAVNLYLGQGYVRIGEQQVAPGLVLTCFKKTLRG